MNHGLSIMTMGMDSEVAARNIKRGMLGLLLGAGFIHPMSMLFQGIVHPAIDVDIRELLNAYDVHHLPMALFFGVLGMFCLIVLSYYSGYSGVLTRERKRIEVLEGLLPICSYCKKIRDDAGTERGNGKWHEVEQYISHKTGTDFTHGICDACCEKMLKEL